MLSRNIQRLKLTGKYQKSENWQRQYFLWEIRGEKAHDNFESIVLNNIQKIFTHFFFLIPGLQNALYFQDTSRN